MYVENNRKRKEVNTMKYTTPDLTALTFAINAIQDPAKPEPSGLDGVKEEIAAYADWED